MDKERLYLRFEGIVVSIESINKRKGEDLSAYARHVGMVELLWSRSSRYTRMFAVFKETAWPSHNVKTTPGVLEAANEMLILTTKNHIYTFKILQVYADGRTPK